RRQATDYKELPNAFVTVSDAFQKGNEVIKEIAKLDVISGDPAAIGLRITHAGGTTYVCSTTRDDAATVFRDVKNNQSFTLTGRLGVAVLQAGKPMLLTLLNGTGIKQ
ncbi:MAG TPA: hypothetical protein PLT23_10655, partial [Lentisphaeria bacterium]|nr:hypothetical protein [Lentisphaeria bacterium]